MPLTKTNSAKTRSLLRATRWFPRKLAYRMKLDRVAGLGPSMTIGLKGQNLADDEVLNSASFKRRENVLLPGANVRLFGSIKLN